MKKQVIEEMCCTSCGGRLEQKSKYICQCSSCGRGYYTSTERLRRIHLRLSVKKLVILLTAIAMIAGTSAIVAYELYTTQLAESARRFSAAFRDFLLEVYDMPVADIGEEELSRIKYLKIEKQNAYLFTYSFEDYYDYEDKELYEQTMEMVVVNAVTDEFLPADLQYFSGLTRLELYTDAWQNYVLPPENELRSISCKNGFCKIGTPEFFSATNPHTLEEVVILDADELTDDSFLTDIRQVKRLTIDKMPIKDADTFAGLDQLEELTLRYPSIEEEKVCEVIESVLRLPAIKRLTVEGNTLWYLTDEEWKYLQETYGEKVAFERV